MDADFALIERLYACFNARDMEGVLAALAEDVAWANGMDGGHVHGRDGVREYWTRQWAMVSPHVAPVAFRRGEDGAIVVAVVQTVRDLEGRPLEGQAHGLSDKTVGHVFRLRDGEVARFDIEGWAGEMGIVSLELARRFPLLHLESAPKGRVQVDASILDDQTMAFSAHLATVWRQAP